MTVDFHLFVEGAARPEDFKRSLELSASSQGGGFVVLTVVKASALKSVYEAPEQGYSPVLSSAFKYDQTRGLTGTPIYHKDDEYAVFRSRVVLDEKGNVVRSHYGKLYEDFLFGPDQTFKPAHVRFLHHFNPTANDRNIECDGKNFLFTPTLREQFLTSQDP